MTNSTSWHTLHRTARRTARGLAALAAVTLAAACSDSVGLEATTGGDGQTLTVARFGTLGMSGRNGQASDNERQRALITDDAAWTRFWASLAPDPAANGAAPAVDFSKSMVIAAAMPVRPSGGYQLQIEKVTEYADRIEAEVVERSPGASCFTTGAITRPFDVVQVPRRDKPVRFVERSVVASCDAAARADTVRAALGKPVDVRGVRVTLTKVESDSRCPMNAVCIWEGDAAVALRFEQGGRTVDVTLHTSPKGGVVSTTIGGVELSLIGLTPYPVAGGTPPVPSEYTAIIAAR